MANQFMKSITLANGQVTGGQFVTIAEDDLPRPTPNPAGTWHVVTVDQWGRVVGGQSGGNVVTTFNTRTGDVTLSLGDVTTADPNIVHTNTTNTFSVGLIQTTAGVSFNIQVGDTVGVDAGNLSFASGSSTGEGSGGIVNVGGGKVSGQGGTIDFTAGAGVDETTGGSCHFTAPYGGSCRLSGGSGPVVEASGDFGSGLPTLGFYGTAPVLRPTLTTGTGLTVDDVITALQTLGLVQN